MEKKRPMLIATEDKNKLPVLIIDKNKTMGMQFAAKLTEQFLVILVSGKQLPFSQNTIHIPYRRKTPKIPDNKYSHMFVFYNGEEEIIDILPAVAKKAEEIDSKLFFITTLSHVNRKLLNHISSHTYLNMQTIIYGEVFQPEGREENHTTAFLNQARRFGKIVIPHEVGRLYPVLLDDVFEAIIDIAFAPQKRKKIVFVFPRHAVTELSIARMIKKKFPELKLDFKNYKTNIPAFYIPDTGEYYFEQYPLEKKLQTALSLPKQEQAQNPHKKEKIHLPKKHLKLSIGTVFLILTAGLIFPIIVSVFTGVIGAGALTFSLTQLEKGRVKEAFVSASLANTALKFSSFLGENLFYIDFIAKTPREKLFRQFSIAKTLAETEEDMLNSAMLLQKITDNKSIDPKGDFQKILVTFKNSLITFQRMQAEQSLPRDVGARLVELEKTLSPLENTLDSMPYLLGFEGEKTYLVLLQNNMELRPGGGFIGSYGILQIDKGRVTSFKVYDVYDADGKLTTHIEPPFAIRRYLGASHWFLRDSNFAIDFPTNAEKAEMILKLETGDRVDGVIAVDTNFLKNILEAVGPITVSDYKETVTKDNFYLLTQNHAEKDFFPGSTQKKDFLRALLSSMQIRLTADKNMSYFVIAKALSKSISEKHLFFAFSDPPSQKLFTVNNLSSSLWDGREQKKNTFLDFFAVIDANLGLNKSNYYLKRTISKKISIDDRGTAQTTATVTYTNNSKKGSPFGGAYKNYLRFVVPTGSILKSVSFDDVTQKTKDAVTDPEIFTAKGFLTPKELEVEHGIEQGKDTFGLLISVPIEETRKISIVYENPEAVDVNRTDFSYDVKVFKQPGTDSDLFDFTFSFPKTFQLLSASYGLSDVGGKLLYSGALSEDMDLSAEFGRR